MYDQQGWVFIVPLLLVLGVWYFVPRDILSRSRRIDALQQRVESLVQTVEEQRVVNAAMAVKVDLYWSVIQTRVGSLAKDAKLHTLDSLIDTFREGNATVEELHQLLERLDKRSFDDLGLQQKSSVKLLQIFVQEQIEGKTAIAHEGQTSMSVEDKKTQPKLEQEQIAAGERKGGGK
jgi:hypothetical protein